MIYADNYATVCNTNLMVYESFISSKQRPNQSIGFEIAESDLNPNLFDWQRRVVAWAIQQGRAALFEGCGLGKTLQQLAWADAIVKRTGKPVLLLCPIGVKAQTIREAAKFKIDTPVTEAADIQPGERRIGIINYERLHHIDATNFVGVVLDESSVLKNFTGVVKQTLCETFSTTPYRLACTATPAPNDHMELGNHAEFLGIMPSNEMLSRWFINDTMKAGGYRLKGHAKSDFWSWVASWAACLSSPSDYGGSDDGFNLPPLNIERHFVATLTEATGDGYLFATSSVNATNIHEVKRLSLEARVAKTVELERSKSGPCVIWCDTNYEADAIGKAIPHAVDVRGSDSESAKELKLKSFSDGEIQTLVTKPSVAGMGMNWQHCHRQIFAGQSFSFELYYQAVRRCWRFGQTKPVKVDIVLADTDQSILSAIGRKEADHELMRSGMASAMKQVATGQRQRKNYQPTVPIQIPLFLRQKSLQS